MKKGLIALMIMMAAAGTVANAAAQKHRHSPTTSATTATTDSTQQQEEVVAFSDTTTTTAQTDTVAATANYGIPTMADMIDDLHTLGTDYDPHDIIRMLTFAAIVFSTVVLAPVLLLLIVAWLIRKNRQDKLRMAELAMKSGQPIPDELLGRQQGHMQALADANSSDDLWQKGIRQTFLGVGLIFFLGYTAGEIGFGIGALVTCLGIGKLVIVKTSGKKKHPDDEASQPF